jgi:hypothetical protein
MNLWYIGLDLDRDIYGNDFGYAFMRNTRFISNYLSKAIRKYRFKTDGSFNMISIKGSDRSEDTRLVPLECLVVTLPFDKKRYDEIRGTEDCSYYLDLYKNGFIKAAEFKQIPINELLHLLCEFERGGCKNKWLHKKKKFKEHDIEAMLTCEFTTNYFQLVLSISKVSTKELIVEGPILRTEPDEVLFEGMYRDVLIVADSLVVTDSSDSARIVIDICSALQRELRFDIVGDKEIQEILSYGL